MRLATVEQSQEIDQLSQTVYGVSGELLMESAGVLSAREIEQSFFPELKRGTVALICGPGNNGGDGLVLARHLHSMGYRDLLVYITESDQVSDLFQAQLKRVELHGIKVIPLSEQPEKLNSLRSAELVVDALFGIGLNRPIDGEYLKLVDTVNSVKVPIVSLDCPSGLDCDRGNLLGHCINASMTLTYGLAKPGFFVSEGPSVVGQLRILPIGFPYESLRGVATTHFLFNDRLARRYLPKRSASANKTDHGHAVIIAGSEGMWGAGILASQAAFRMGSGYVTWASFEAPEKFLMEAPEVFIRSLEDKKNWLHDKVTAYGVGPGLGVGHSTAEILTQLKDQPHPVVVDADAITTCVESNLFPLPKNWILTPHAGELSRITKASSHEIEQDRFASALNAAEITGCHVLLKGFRSVLAYQDRVMVINSGNSALAKAGTGDVLTGMITGLLAQGLDTLQGASTAAYIHGRMADEWVRVGQNKRSLMASDLTHHLPQLISRLEEGSLLY